jgi:hypothetical protein
MGKILAMAIAVAVTAGSIAPVLAADKTPANKADCEKAHMKWDSSSKTCSKGGY